MLLIPSYLKAESKIIYNDPADWSQKDSNQSILITDFDEL